MLVIVPNTIPSGGFRQRLVAAGGALGVEVHTFHTLYAELLACAGQPIPLLTDPVRLRLLCNIVDGLCEQGKSPLPLGEDQGVGTIRQYAALRDKPGFITALRNTIEELKRARILPEDFARSTRDLEPRLGEIAMVYSAYQRWLQENHWADWRVWLIWVQKKCMA